MAERRIDKNERPQTTLTSSELVNVMKKFKYSSQFQIPPRDLTDEEFEKLVGFIENKITSAAMRGLDNYIFVNVYSVNTEETIKGRFFSSKLVYSLSQNDMYRIYRYFEMKLSATFIQLEDGGYEDDGFIPWGIVLSWYE